MEFIEPVDADLSPVSRGDTSRVDISEELSLCKFEDLPPKIVEQRKEFVREYVKDRSAVKALMRMGYFGNRIIDVAEALMREPLVEKLIVEFEESEEAVAYNCKAERIVAKISEIASCAKADADRLKAFAMLASMAGLDVGSVSRKKTIPTVMAVPVLDGDWESAASGSQEKLLKKCDEISKI